MANRPSERRTDRASRLIAASPHVIYRALLDPAAWVQWMPPDGMVGEIHVFEAHEGGTYRMSLTYERPRPDRVGKSSDDTDVVDGHFVELVPNRRVVLDVTFISDDPAFAGEMVMTWNLAPSSSGTEVGIVCENVPPGISAEDHDIGLRSTLANLARFVE